MKYQTWANMEKGRARTRLVYLALAVLVVLVLAFAGGCSTEQLGWGLDLAKSVSKDYLVEEAADKPPGEREKIVKLMREYAGIADEISENLTDAADRIESSNP